MEVLAMAFLIADSDNMRRAMVPHFDAACASDIAELDDIACFPIKPLVEAR